MERNRLTITTESRILGDEYVRFGGEYIETCFHKGKQGALCLAIEMQEVKKDEEARKKQEQKAEAERVAQEKQAEAMRIANEKAEKEAFVGRYIYKYYYHGTNIELYFVITLKSDGTFTHEPSNDQTRSIVEMETLVDGKDYPSGGKWKVKETPAGKAAFLDFGSSWGEGSITPDQKVLEIDNMNGVRLKAQLLKD